MSWLTGFGNTIEDQDTEEELEEEKSYTTEEFDGLIDKYTDIIEKKINEKAHILTHFTIQLPLFEIYLYNSRDSNGSNKTFCRMRMHEIFYQHSGNQMGKLEHLFSIDDVRLINDSCADERFESVFRKKPKPSTLTEDESDEFLSRANSDLKDDSETAEIDGNS